MIKINFSGHPVEGWDLAPLVGRNVRTDAVGALEDLWAALDSLPREIRYSLETGVSAEIIPPGMGWITAMLLAEWHGRFGSFPRIRWAVRRREGFCWPEDATVDLENIRCTARLKRGE